MTRRTSLKDGLAHPSIKLIIYNTFILYKSVSTPNSMKSFSVLIAIIIAIFSLSLGPIRVFSALRNFVEPLSDTFSRSCTAQSHANIIDIISWHWQWLCVAKEEPDSRAQEVAMSTSRAIRKIFLAVEQAEGAGARVRRSIGTPQLRNFSPFLMLDHFSIKPGAGFPDQ